MGVPAFFGWLSENYPLILEHCVEDKPKEVDGETIPVDTSQPNPNDYEFDNLYLDMNSLIHPCWVRLAGVYRNCLGNFVFDRYSSETTVFTNNTTNCHYKQKWNVIESGIKHQTY